MIKNNMIAINISFLLKYSNVALFLSTISVIDKNGKMKQAYLLIE